jgi:hypothetical protein
MALRRATSANDLERELRRAAACYELRQVVPVDALCEFHGEQARQAETLQLLDVPGVDQCIVVWALVELCI